VAKFDTSSYENFEGISARLSEIVTQVKDKGVSLERSLDLFDEALALGAKAVEMVDIEEPSAHEAADATDAPATADATPATDQVQTASPEPGE
jgi:exodeoxyribonuclease VII small subunit